MHPRAAHLITSLNLSPHPEGGHFREIYRSRFQISPQDERSARAALTTIYFLLTEGEVSRWHRVVSDEAWHYCEGDALELLIAEPDLQTIAHTVLGPLTRDVRPIEIVPANHWQAARPLGTYTLVSCSVAPGFEFADFSMLSDLAAEREKMQERFPDLASLI